MPRPKKVTTQSNNGKPTIPFHQLIYPFPVSGPSKMSIRLPELKQAKGAEEDWPLDVYFPCELCKRIQRGSSIDQIKEYLDDFHYEFKNQRFNDSASTAPNAAIFYAVERNSPDCVELILQHFNCANSCADTIPVLGFAILHGHQKRLDVSKTVRILLSYGANHEVIPREMWYPYISSPQIPENEVLQYTPAEWCMDCRYELAEALHLQLRYLLYRASQFPDTSPRFKQIGEALGILRVLNLPHYIIGQWYATKLVMETLFAHWAFKTNEPLVISFTGPSGHGKTEMAMQLGELLSVKQISIDCGQMHHDCDLFGARGGYERSREGSRLNNFLSSNAGKRSVVFLDECDKTSKQVLDSLLCTMDKGDYEDRRNNSIACCRNTIWILGTNLGINKILEFHRKNFSGRDNQETSNISMKGLQKDLRGIFNESLGSYFTGRIALIVPFLPFSLNEAAVISHKFLLEAVDKLRQPVDCSPQVLRYIGHCHLQLENEGAICQRIAVDGYDKSFGARSVKNEVNQYLAKLVGIHCNIPEKIDENIDRRPFTHLVMALKTEHGAEDKIAIYRKGVIDLNSTYKSEGDRVLQELSFLF